MPKLIAAALAAFAVAGVSVSGVSAQSGAKALFYGSSGAQLQSNAPLSGPMMSRPDAPGSTMTGFTSTPPPGMPAPQPTMPAMAPQPSPAMPPSSAPPAVAGAPSMPPPAGAPAAPGAPTEDVGKIMDELKAAVDALPPNSTAMAPPGTKDLKAAGATPTAAPAMGVKYWVELIDSKGTRRQVTTEHVFRAGDRIKLHMTSNRDGFLTLVNLGSSGRTTVLFPTGGANNFVKAEADYAVPPNGYLRFDENPGEETLILTFSPQAGTPTPQAALAMARGSKDLLLEVDASSAQPATYAVAPARSANEPGTVATQIKLNHR